MLQSGKRVLACKKYILGCDICPNGENTNPWNNGFQCGHDDDDPELEEERVLPFRVTRALHPCFHRQRQHTNWIWQG